MNLKDNQTTAHSALVYNAQKQDCALSENNVYLCKIVFC